MGSPPVEGLWGLQVAPHPTRFGSYSGRGGHAHSPLAESGGSVLMEAGGRLNRVGSICYLDKWLLC